LQAAGGAITATADDREESDMGVNIMMAGLSCQVASLLLFVVLCAEYGLRVRKSPQKLNVHFNQVYNTNMWKMFVIGKSTTSACVCVESITQR
jgi:hypothetical protein